MNHFVSALNQILGNWQAKFKNVEWCGEHYFGNVGTDTTMIYRVCYAVNG